MDIGTAHFARLEFATDSEISLPFGKHLAAISRRVVSSPYAVSPSASREAPLGSKSNNSTTLLHPEDPLYIPTDGPGGHEVDQWVQKLPVGSFEQRGPRLSVL